MDVLAFIGLLVVAGAIGGLASSLSGIRKSLSRLVEIQEQNRKESNGSKNSKVLDEEEPRNE